MNHKLYKLLPFLGILTPSLLWGQTDACGAGSTLLTSGTSCSYTNGNTTGFTDSNQGCDTGTEDDDGWYRFVAAATSHTVTVDGGADFDAVVGVYSSCGGTTVTGGTCTDNTGTDGIETLSLSGLTVGTTYFISVHDYWTGGGSFQICVTHTAAPVAPANDNPCSATALTVSATCSYTAATNANATASAGVPAPGCASYSGGDVWFTAVVPASGNLTIDTDDGVMTDGGMAVYSGTCGALTLIECDDDDSANGFMPMIALTGRTPGETIYIRVWEYSNDNNGAFSICAYGSSAAPAPANDDPCSATAISVGALNTCNFTTYTTTGATNSSLTTSTTLPTCSNFNGGDVWFTVTVPASGHLIFDTQVGVVTDGGMAIYRGTCGSLTELDCDDDNSDNGLMPLIQQTTLVPGETIWIRFWEYGNDNPGTFQLCVYDGGTVNGGTCTGGIGGATCGEMAPFCTSNTYCFTAQTSTTAEAGNDYGCLSTQPNPAWYYFEISQAGNLVFDMTATSDIDFAIWGPYNSLADAGADCGTLPAPVDCSYSVSPTEQGTLTGVTVGQVYILVVTNFANVVQDITITVAGGNTAATNCSIISCGAEAGGW